MMTLSIGEVRRRLSVLGNHVSLRGERILVERQGRRVFALVPVEDLEVLERLEDRLDLEAIRSAGREANKSWVAVKRALGL